MDFCQMRIKMIDIPPLENWGTAQTLNKTVMGGDGGGRAPRGNLGFIR